MIHDPIVGHRILAVRPMTDKELQDEGWDMGLGEAALAIVLDDGSVIYASQDGEGNGPGVLFAHDVHGKGFYIAPGRLGPVR